MATPQLRTMPPGYHRRCALVLGALGLLACGSPQSGGATGKDAGADAPADGATGSMLPSCAPGGDGMTSCGAAQDGCCTSLLVQGGTYFRTYTNSGSGASGIADPATVGSFLLDEYEVTVGRFRSFAAAVSGVDGGTGWRPAQGSGKHTHLNGGAGLVLGSTGTTTEYESGWVIADDPYLDGPLVACDPQDAAYVTWTASPGSNEKLPVNCVTWFVAFCIWDGGFLPSEAEWEFAAAGGAQLREYVWGTTPPGTSSQYAVYDCEYPSGSGPCTGVRNIAPVGTATLGAGAWGQLDLAGNVYEWNMDVWDDALYPDPCTDCAYLTLPAGNPQPYRVARGSAYDDTSSPPIYLVPPGRNYATGSGHDKDIGFRCARSP
jgi:sulfatase modifying factor 1